jgi:hypothetical protein
MRVRHGQHFNGETKMQRNRAFLTVQLAAAAMLATSGRTLASQGALDKVKPSKEQIAASEKAAAERKAAAQADFDAVTPDRHSDWRRQMPAVRDEFAGKISPDLSRQEARKLERTVAKITAIQAKQRARNEAKLARKSRRAQRAVKAHAAR